jgi:hypothetical protein
MKWLASIALASCASFEDPAVVIDLRVIAMTAPPPEQVLDIEVDPPSIGDLIDQLETSIVCATVADPGRAANLRWSMTACLSDNGRCDPARPSFELASGEAVDPELVSDPICAPVPPSSDLVAVLLDAHTNDPIGGLAGLTYAIELRVGAVDAPADQDQFAHKELRVFARIPADRVPNHNPGLRELRVLTPEVLVPTLASCADDRPRIQTSPRARLDLLPVELDSTRENYPVLAIDGSFENFDETIRYQYLITAGEVSDEFGGGPHDLLGNVPRLGTTWTAPDVDSSTDVRFWIVQRDERGGASVYPLCVRVIP